jgi:predicted  nucleic acid-binding Zn-ribbon protein
MERKDYEKKLEKLTSRISAKRVDLDATRSELHKNTISLAAEDMGAKWDKLAEQHGILSVRETALVDDIAELGRQIHGVHLAISDLDLAEVQGELAKLHDESTEIRLKSSSLRDEFRRAVSKRSADEVHKLKIIDMKSELERLGVAGELTRRHIDAAKVRRATLIDERARIEAE